LISCCSSLLHTCSPRRITSKRIVSDIITMAKSKGKKKGGKNKKLSKGNVHVTSVSTNNKQQQGIWSASDECEHYAELGCHIVNIARCRPDRPATSPSSSSYTCSDFRYMYEHAMQIYPWLIGIERFDSSDYHPEDIDKIPDVAMDDEEMILTLTNVTQSITKICYVTVYDVDVCDVDGNVLKSGVSSTTTSVKDSSTTTTTTKERKCTTFIILCPPQTFVHLCSLTPNQTQDDNTTPITSWSQIDIESDIQPWSFHPNIDDAHPYLLHFPFHGLISEEEGSSEVVDAITAYRCTQSCDGQLTHFFHGNYHAIDFACPVGTPLYSPVNGVIIDVNDSITGGKEVSGIAASNMFQWNSIMIRVEDESVDATTDPLYVEFVHIQTDSCVVQVDDKVKKGQLICRSGSVGFSPEPHLHLAAYRSNGDDAATVCVRFDCIGRSEGDATAEPFLPQTGGCYNQSGLVSNYKSSTNI